MFGRSFGFWWILISDISGLRFLLFLSDFDGSFGFGQSFGFRSFHFDGFFCENQRKKIRASYKPTNSKAA